MLSNKTAAYFKQSQVIFRIVDLPVITWVLKYHALLNIQISTKVDLWRKSSYWIWLQAPKKTELQKTLVYLLWEHQKLRHPTHLRLSLNRHFLHFTLYLFLFFSHCFFFCLLVCSIRQKIFYIAVFLTSVPRFQISSNLFTLFLLRSSTKATETFTLR